MTAFLVLLRKELTEQWRTWRMPSLLVIFFFVGASSPASARYLPDLLKALGNGAIASALPAPTIVDAYAQLAKNIAQIGAIVTVVIAMAAVSGERERGSLAFLLSKPVGRTALLVAKLAGFAATLALGMLVAGVAAFLYTALLFAPPSGGFVLLCLASFLTLMVFATITVAASAITGSTVPAAGTGMLALVLLGIVSTLPNVGAYTPAGAISRAVEVVAGAPADGLFGPLLAQLAWITVAFAAAAIVFRRQEV